MLTIFPASSAAVIVGAVSGSTPQTRTPGFTAFTAAMMPAISPPPPMLTMMSVIPGQSSRISSATPPLPAICARLSKGCKAVRPCAAYSSARAKAATASGSNSTVAP